MGEVARLQYGTQKLFNFQGVNLRRERTLVQDTELVRAINADLHTSVGSIMLRRGRSLVYALPTGAGTLRWQQTFGGTRYAIAGSTLYKAGASLITGLSGSTQMLASMRPLNDTVTWTFIGDASSMRKEAGGTVRTWGIAAPTATPVIAAGTASALQGFYTVSYTYVRKVGSAIAHESNPSPTSAAVNILSTDLAVSNLVASTDPQVTHIRLYRTVSGGSVRLFDQELTNGTTTATSSVADTGLGAAVETDNHVPPVAPWITPHQEHMFFLDPANPNYLWWSKRFRPESVPTTNYIVIGTISEPLVGMVSMVGLLGVFTAKTKYRVLGNETSGFVHQEALSSRGTPAPQAALVTEKGCIFPARDGLFRTNFVQEDEELSGLIAPLFDGRTVNGYLPINWNAAATMSLAYYKSRLYFAYPSGDQGSPDMVAVYSFHTNQWYFYQMNVDSLYVEEETDQLFAGQGDVVTALESGMDDLGQPITMIVEPANRDFDDQFLRKRFDYVRVDADVQHGSILCEVYIDDIRVRRLLLTGHVPRLLRLGGIQGFTWRVVLTYTGRETVAINGVEMQALPLEMQ